MCADDMTLWPVGFVRVRTEGFVVEIEPQYRAGLNGLTGFSHVNILWWSHLLDGASGLNRLVSEAPYRNAPRELGVFATRSPLRPNAICLSAAPLIAVDVQAGILRLGYIDAEDGTPVLDIKPYHPSADRVREVGLPAWCRDWPQCFEDSAAFDWESVFEQA